MQHRSTLSKKGKLPSISNRNTATTTNNKDNKNESDDPQGKSKQSKVVIMWRVFAAAALYVLSGSTQPLLMTLVKQSGLGDPTCQLYMLFYYLGPALVSLSFIRIPSSFRHIDTTARPITSPSSPTRNALLKSAGIASIDIIAQAMNYTGSTFCGPTIFANSNSNSKSNSKGNNSFTNNNSNTYTTMMTAQTTTKTMKNQRKRNNWYKPFG